MHFLMKSNPLPSSSLHRASQGQPILDWQKLNGLTKKLFDLRREYVQRTGATALITNQTAAQWFDLRAPGMLTLGKSGYGKSVATYRFFLTDAFSAQHHALWIDPEPMSFDFLLASGELAAVAEQGRLTWISPENPGLGFNLLNSGIDTGDILQRIETAPLSDAMNRVWEVSLLAIQAINGTLLDLYAVLRGNEAARRELIERLNARKKQQNLAVRMISEVFQTSDRRTLEGICSRLAKLLSHPYLRQLLCSTEESLNLPGLLGSPTPQVILMNIGGAYQTPGGFKEPLGASHIRLLGQVLLALVQLAAFSRPENSGKPLFLTMDEFQDFSNNDTLSVLAKRGRKWRICTNFVTQTLAGIEEKTSRSLLGALNQFQLFCLAESDAKLFESTLQLRDYESSFGDSDSRGFYINENTLCNLTTLPKYCSLLAHNSQIRFIDYRQQPEPAFYFPGLDIRPLLQKTHLSPTHILKTTIELEDTVQEQIITDFLQEQSRKTAYNSAKPKMIKSNKPLESSPFAFHLESPPDEEGL